jgi:hypothetical protein
MFPGGILKIFFHSTPSLSPAGATLILRKQMTDAITRPVCGITLPAFIGTDSGSGNGAQETAGIAAPEIAAVAGSVHLVLMTGQRDMGDPAP